MGARETDVILKHVYCEPKFVAQVKWMNEYPSPIQQMLGQVGEAAALSYVATGQWPDPDLRVSVVAQPEEPDWDWWEPRYDQPWRREHARDRELDAKLRGKRSA